MIHTALCSVQVQAVIAASATAVTAIFLPEEAAPPAGHAPHDGGVPVDRTRSHRRVGGATPPELRPFPPQIDVDSPEPTLSYKGMARATGTLGT